MAEESKFQPALVKQLAKVLDEANLNEIEYEIQGHRIKIVRHNKETHVYAAPQPMLAAQQAAPTSHGTSEVASIAAKEVIDWNSHPGAIKSPMVGNAYLSSEPGTAPFVSVGSEVKEGQTLLIIEAMKVMNPIKAPVSGKISKILISDTSPVEYDEVLMIIE